jgi:hypothetical protein
MPLHVSITGFLCGLAAVILLVVALVQSVRGEAGISHYGWLCLAAVSGVGIFGAVRFLNGRSPKYLMLALTLGVLVDLTFLIGVPIYQANFASFGDDNIEIKPIAERLDMERITLGFIVILLYALLSVYMMSPSVKRFFARRALAAAALASEPIRMDE